MSARRAPSRFHRAAAAVVLALVATPAALAAQRDSSATADTLPAEVAAEVARLYNATATLRVSERVEVPASRVVDGNVAVLNGPVVVAGRITGRVLAVNADVLLAPGARIDGDLLVVGGEVEGREAAVIGGEVRTYHAPLRYRLDGDRLVLVGVPARGDVQWWRRFERRGRRNFNRLEIATAGPYNRTEGLPIRVGPVLYRDQGWGHLFLAAGAVVRTASTFTGPHADVGNDVRAEIRAGREYGVTVGGRLFDLVDAVEEWQLQNVEIGLGTFLLHRDDRDYFGRHGGQLSLALRATESADVTAALSDERWVTRETLDPLTVAGNGTAWRPNPRLDEGRFHLASFSVRVDTRNDVFNPFAGWYLLSRMERGTGVIDALGATSAGARAGRIGRTRYTRGFVDLRRYNRVAPNAALNVRVVLAGWLGGDPLPLERRLSLGGPGSIPGFDFRSAAGTDVGTCASGVAPPGRPAQCERIALAQLEYRGAFRLSWTTERGTHSRLRADGAWVFFADAGRGWTVNASGYALDLGRAQLPPLSTYRTDLGVGLDFGWLGVYVAKAVSLPSEPANVFVRAGHRF